MMHAKSDSDVTSLAASSPPRSPKRPVYYVQSPSRDSHDEGDKSTSSMHATPAYNSPTESPSHPSFLGRHSRASSASRFSGTFGGRKGGGGRKQRRLNEKGWPECDVIQEEGSYGDIDGDGGIPRRCQVVLALLIFVLLFTAFCLIIWGASRPYKPDIVVKSLSMDYFYSGSGSDDTGVPTKMITVNCSLKITVHNSASTFGIHVNSGPISLIYSQITIATGELQGYYQKRKSSHTVSVVVKGEKVPLYGAGANLALSSTGGSVHLTLDFELLSRANIVGKLVRVKHQRHVSCPLVVDSSNNKPIMFSKDACTID